MVLATVDCDPDKEKPGEKKRRRKKRDKSVSFTLLSGSGGLFGSDRHRFKGKQLKVNSTDLCLHRDHVSLGSRALMLKQCNATLREQRFLGFHTGGQAMILQPEDKSFTKRGVEYERCLTQVSASYDCPPFCC